MLTVQLWHFLGIFNGLTCAEITRLFLELSIQANEFSRVAEIFFYQQVKPREFSKLQRTHTTYFGLHQLVSYSD